MKTIMKTPTKLTDLVSRCPKESLDSRLLYCAGMHHIYEVITDAERLKIHRRMIKRRADERKV